MRRGAGFAVGIGVAVLILFLMLYASHNSLKRLDYSVKTARGNVTSDLQQRLDLFSRLLTVLDESPAGDREALAPVRAARRRAAGAGDLQEKFLADQGIGAALVRLDRIAPGVPGLSSDDRFRQLRRNLEAVGESINASRRRYNQAVRDYNAALIRFPTWLVARLLNFKPKYGCPASAGEPGRFRGAVERKAGRAS